MRNAPTPVSRDALVGVIAQIMVEVGLAVAVSVGVSEAVGVRLQQYSPVPPRARTVNILAVNAGRSLVTATDAMSSAVRSGNAAKLRVGASRSSRRPSSSTRSTRPSG